MSIVKTNRVILTLYARRQRLKANGVLIVYRIIILTVISMFVLVLCAAIGFCILPFGGEIIGLLIALIYLIVVYFLGDKILLSLICAKVLPEENQYVSIVMNLTCRFGMSNVHVYTSKKYADGLYFIETLNHSSSIVIGYNLLKQLPEEELKNLIFGGLVLKGDGIIRYKCILSCLFVFFEWPRVLNDVIVIKKFKWMVNIINFYLYPFHLLKWLLSGKELAEKLINNTDNSKTTRIIQSTLFKVKNVNYQRNNVLINGVLEQMAIIHNGRKSLWDNLSGLHGDILDHFISDNSV